MFSNTAANTITNLGIMKAVLEINLNTCQDSELNKTMNVSIDKVGDQGKGGTSEKLKEKYAFSHKINNFKKIK